MPHSRGLFPYTLIATSDYHDLPSLVGDVLYIPGRLGGN